MQRARFIFREDLPRFLRPSLRGGEFDHTWPDTDTLMHVVESLGVPHTEVGRIERNGDAVLVTPAVAPPDTDRRFVIDTHLGRLAAYLRMAGYDAWYARHAADEELAARSGAENRILLTRDSGLLKRREVQRGRFVRSTAPAEQLREVVRFFGLEPREPRCAACNGELSDAPAESVAARVPPRARESYREFRACSACGRVFWRGSHFRHLDETLRHA